MREKRGSKRIKERGGIRGVIRKRKRQQRTGHLLGMGAGRSQCRRGLAGIRTASPVGGRVYII